MTAWYTAHAAYSRPRADREHPVHLIDSQSSDNPRMAWNDQTVLTITERRENPFTLKEITESLSAGWDGTAEVLDRNEAYRELMGGW